MKASDVLSALTDVRDSFVLESALPPAGKDLPPVTTSGRGRERDRSLGRLFTGGWLVAAVCALVSAATLWCLIYLGQNPPIPPVGTEGVTVKPPESGEEPVTEDKAFPSLVFVSRGDGTCSVKASKDFGSRAEDSHLVIPAVSPDGDQVTAVEDYGFLWKKSLCSVTLPESLETIGQWAFAECGSLETVLLSEGVTSIGTAAFLECTALSEVRLPEGLTHLGDSAFSSCTSLKRVTVPGSLGMIPQWAFYHCAALEELTLAEGVTSIGYSAFYGCGSLTSLTLPATLHTLSKGAFAQCGGLMSVSVGEGLTTLESLAFDKCVSLVSVTLPASLEILSGDAFRDCGSLRTVVYTGAREGWRALTENADPLPAGCNVHCADGVVKH